MNNEELSLLPWGKEQNNFTEFVPYQLSLPKVVYESAQPLYSLPSGYELDPSNGISFQSLLDNTLLCMPLGLCLSAPCFIVVYYILWILCLPLHVGVGGRT